MAPNRTPRRDATTPHAFLRTTSKMKYGQRRAQAFELKCLSSLKATPETDPAKNPRRRSDSVASQRPHASTNTCLITPTKPFYHNTDQLGKAVPEFRLAMKWAGIDGRPHSRQRRGSRSGSDRGQGREETPSSWNIEDSETADGGVGLLERDWEEDDEESERPCYWSLLEELNRELRLTGK